MLMKKEAIDYEHILFFKQSFVAKCESYLQISNFEFRKSFPQLRISAHNLRIEKTAIAKNISLPPEDLF